MYAVTELIYTYEQSYYVLCDRVDVRHDRVITYSVTALMYTYEQS